MHVASSVTLEATPLENQAAARSAIVAYRDLLHTLARHGQALFGEQRNMFAVRAAINPDERDAVGARMIDQLAHIGQRNLMQEP